MNAKETHWTQIIEPPDRLFDLKLNEVWQYRDLVYLFVYRDFVAQYKQTILGPLWHVIQPLLTTVIFTIIFGKVAKLPTDGLPPFLFYLAGTVIWQYFAAVLTGSSGTFIQNAAIFGKVYFPRLVMPISTLLSKLIAFGIQFAIFLGFLLYFWLHETALQPNLWMLATPVLLLLMAMLGLGLGVIVSALTTRYRDLQILVSFGVQLLMYATPVIYPLSMISEQYRWLVVLNPIAPIVETFRYAFLGSGTIDLVYLSYSTLVIVLIFVGGVMLFNKVERTFMDTI